MPENKYYIYIIHFKNSIWAYVYVYIYMYNYILSISMCNFFMRVLLLTLSMWWYSFSQINLARAISTSHLCIDLALFQLYLGRRVVYQVLVGLIAFGYPKISWVVFTCSLQNKNADTSFTHLDPNLNDGHRSSQLLSMLQPSRGCLRSRCAMGILNRILLALWISIDGSRMFKPVKNGIN